MSRNGARGGPLDLGVLILLFFMLRKGFENVPPTTLYAVLGMLILYIGWLNVPWGLYDKCMSLRYAWYEGEYSRIVISQMEHANSLHLLFNMVAFVFFGTFLETKFGSVNFTILLCLLTFLTGIIYLFLSWICYSVTGYEYYLEACGIGFSGVIYALEMIHVNEVIPYVTYILGEPVSSKYSTWIGLIINWMFAPNSSLLGHLAGIFAGLLYSSTLVGTMFDTFLRILTGEAPSHHLSAVYLED